LSGADAQTRPGTQTPRVVLAGPPSVSLIELMQSPPSLQARPHAPQLLGSDATEMHDCPQQIPMGVAPPWKQPWSFRASVQDCQTQLALLQPAELGTIPDGQLTGS
jgi:hypothetical protein